MIEEPVDWKKTSPYVGIQLSPSSCPQQRVVLKVCSRAMHFLPPPFPPTRAASISYFYDPLSDDNPGELEVW